jgi:hypothetical protein
VGFFAGEPHILAGNDFKIALRNIKHEQQQALAFQQSFEQSFQKIDNWL